jgi:hypothetical protein
MILALVYVFVAGALGGVINALMTDNGFVLPKKEKSEKVTIIRPGFPGNILIGGVAALVSWGLYGPVAAINVFEIKAHSGDAILLTLSALAGAVLVGVGGARWLTNEVDKKLLRATGAQAASTPTNQSLARAISLYSPAMAFRAAMGTADTAAKSKKD